MTEGELFDQFIDECKDHLAVMEEMLLKIESMEEKVDSEDINQLFRAVHSIKGSASFFNLIPVEDLGHTIENVCNKLRKKELYANPNVIDVLLQSLDVLSNMINNISDINNISYEEVKSRLNALLEEEISEEPGAIPEEVEDKKEELKTEDREESVEAPSPMPKEIKVEEEISEEPIAIPEEESEEKERKKKRGGRNVKIHESIHIDVKLIDRIMNLAGELVLTRNNLVQISEDLPEINPTLRNALKKLDFITSEIQAHTMLTRMQPIGSLLDKVPRIIRDFARKLSKEAEVIIEGENVELDKTIIEGLADPINHLIRNSITHGIESIGEREKAGKPNSGLIKISVDNEGGQVNIKIFDDGRGINVDKLVEKALEQGFLAPNDIPKMNLKDKLDIMFIPGISTAEEISGLSGRGVGMDIVKTNIQKLGGHFEIESTPGMGTTFYIRVPLTLAIIPCLIVGVQKMKFAIPQRNLKELVRIPQNEINKRVEKVGGVDVLILRDQLLPLIDLCQVLGIKTESKNKKNMKIVSVQIGFNDVGIIVDKFYDNEEIVVKPLYAHLQTCKCFSGATILGDSKIAMVLDVSGLLSLSKLRFGEIKKEEEKRFQKERSRARELMSRNLESILIFNNDKDEYFALPLSLVDRLEKVPINHIKQIGERYFMSFQGEGLPIVYLDEFLPIRAFTKMQSHIYIIIPKKDGGLGLNFGIAASNIVDIYEMQVISNQDSLTTRGILFSHIINDVLTEFLDIQELIRMFEEKYCAK